MLGKPVLPLLTIAFVAGCRHAPPEDPKGSSSFAFVQPPAIPPRKSEGEVEQSKERAQYREAQLRAPATMPVYPAQARKAKALLTTIGVRITVDVEGRVSDVRPSLLVFNTPGPFAEDFRAAAEAAVRQWQFTPARAEHLEIVTEKGFTYTRVARSETIETAFDLAFTFDPSGKVAAGGAR